MLQSLRLPLCRLSIVFALWLACAGGAWAQAADPTPDPDALLKRSEQALDDVEDALADTHRQDFAKLAAAVLEAQRDAQAAAQVLAPQLEQVDARLAQLGPAADGETGDIRNERRALTRQQTTLSSAKKRADLLTEEARQAGETVERQRAEEFSQRLSLRVASPLSPALWSALAQAAPDDWNKLEDVPRGLTAAVRAAIAEHGGGVPLAGLIAALLLAFPVRLFLRHLGRRYASVRAPGGRLRRSGLALWFLCVSAFTLGLAALILVECLRAIDALPDAYDRLGSAFLVASIAAAVISALSVALLMPEMPSWRLFPLADATARRLRWHGHAAALITWISLPVGALNRIAHTGDALTVAIDGAAALLYCALILSALSSLTRTPRGDADAAADPDAVATAAPVTSRHGGVIVLVRLLGHLTVIAALIAALLGFLNLALFLAAQMLWMAMVVGLVALLATFAGDLMAWLFTPEGRFSRALSHALGIRSGRLEQVGVLLAALLQVLLLALGAVALLAGYGTNLSVYSGWWDAAAQGIPLGKNRISFGAIGRALAVLAVGLWLVHALERWLVDTYLPKTELEPGSRNSVSTVARYIGWLLVALWTLAALGIGVEKLALVLSALSVGIGFGLQAITQNFISGLILLAERPVKIGDWVRIGDMEGDIRKINVRATEIQVGDRSTLIVPNSELITKSVRNMTLSNPMGRVQLQFAVPLGTDVDAVRTLLLGIYAEHERTLREPAPSVFIDSIANGQANFNSFVYVSSPRDAYSVRSELLFALLRRMGEQGIALQSPQEIRIHRDDLPPASAPPAP